VSPKSSRLKQTPNNKTPASPPTSRKITLETMLFGDNPKEVNPDTIELLNHDVTKCSIK